MVRYLIKRPIGTSVVAFTLMLLGIITTNFLPVSLLPNIPVPEITVQANYPNADARQIQQIIALPLRNQLLQLNHLDDLEVISQDGQVTVKLRLDFDSDVNLAYLEANEKIDRLMEGLPRDMQRPRVIKASAGDIPIFLLNVSNKNEGDDFGNLSLFCDNVLKRRLEQLQEIALVDITGLARGEVKIRPDISSLQQLGLSVDELSKLITSKSGDLGNVVVRDGPYEYNISFETSLRDRKNIENIHFKVGDEVPRLVRLGDVAEISFEEQRKTGLYVYNGKRAIGLAIIKQSDAQVLRLRKSMDALIREFQKDYPNLDFKISQDQTLLLDLSISNLISSLIIGAILSFVMILFFMRDKRVVLLIGLVIPISLTITLLFFFVFGISINIVSLAGLVLGIGEIVDSAIIIIENIEQHLEVNSENRNEIVLESCVNGAEEVIKPLFTSVLTNSAVFLPLLFMSGIAGALFFDQAIAVSLALGISLLTSYTFIPVFYSQLFKGGRLTDSRATFVATKAELLYNKVFSFAIERPKTLVIFWIMLIASCFWTTKHIEKRGMPEISRTDLETYVNWNESITPEESSRRLSGLLNQIEIAPSEAGLFIGQQQFLLNNRINQSTSEVLMITKVSSSAAYLYLEENISQVLRQQYPRAIFETRPALNVFEQLFHTSEPSLRVNLYGHQKLSPPSLTSIDSLAELFEQEHLITQPLPRRERISIRIREEMLALYNIEANALVQVLRSQLNDYKIGVVQSEQQQIPIILGSKSSPIGLHSLLEESFVPNRGGDLFPIGELISFTSNMDYASLYMGKDGSYVPLEPKLAGNDVPTQIQKITSILNDTPFLTARFTGNYFRTLAYSEELTGIIIIAIAMLFFILAAQFESLQQPFIVLLTIVFGITGGLILLYIAGSSLNIISAIGIVVLIGLLDNDSILKMDTMNRSRGRQSLIQIIRLGGQKRLQSQLMTFLTTVLGLLPILWSSGLGAELQKPLALAVIGGMFIGVFISWTFIPLAYYWLHRTYS